MLNALVTFFRSLFAEPKRDELLIPVRVETRKKQLHRR